MAVPKDRELGTLPVPQLMLRLSLPAVAAQFINVLYNVVDRIYIGNIPEVGDTALTGVGVSVPVLIMISAFAAFAGMGGAPLASIQLGAGRREEAEHILGNCFSLLICLTAALTVFFFLFKRPVLYAFGASDQSIYYAESYLSVYLLGTFFVQIVLGLNSFISAQGFAKTAMFSVMIGAVVNILLDPLFIFVLKLGVQGAAFATVIAQGASALWVLRFLTSSKSGLRIRRRNMKLDRAVLGGVAALGVAPFIMQSTESLVSVVLNSGLQQYGGDLYVGAMTIIMSVLQLIVMPINGFSQGAQPILSYNFGAKQYARVRTAFGVLLLITVSLSTLGCLLVQLFPGVFAQFFSQNEELTALTARMMPIFLGGIWAFGAQMACQTTFLSLGQAKISLFLALLRKVFLLVPLALILPRVLGTAQSIFFAEPAADILASAITLSLFFSKRKKMLPVEEESPPPAAAL